jgi:hypothetical protein
MNSQSATSATPRSPGEGLARLAWAFLFVCARFVALVLYAVLATLGPVARLVTLLLAVVGFAVCGIYGLLLHDPHFPLGLMMLFSISMCLIAPLHELLLQGLSRVKG